MRTSCSFTLHSSLVLGEDEVEVAEGGLVLFEGGLEGEGGGGVVEAGGLLHRPVIDVGDVAPL